MQLKSLAYSLALVGSLGLAASPSLAGGSIKDAPEEPKRELQFSGNFSVTSDYIFRGFSQTGRDPTLQGGIDATYKWFYIGTWASGIDFGEENGHNVANVEWDFYAGIKPVVGRFTFDFGVIYYFYPGARDGKGHANEELDMVELKAGVSFEGWKDSTFGFTSFYSPEFTNKTGDVWTFETSFAQVLPAVRDITPTFSALLGYQVGEADRYLALIGNGSDDYLYWNVGLTLGFGDRFSLDFRYWDTDISNKGGFCTGSYFQCDSTFIATAKVTY